MNENNPSILRRIHYKIISYMTAIGAVWTFLLMFVIMIDVIGRSFFNAPLKGTAEIIRNSIVGITFLQLAHVLRVDRHIRTTIIMDRVSPTIRKLLLILSCLLGAILAFLIIISNWDTTWTSLMKGDYEGEGSLRIPTFPVHFLILLGSFFFLIQFILLFFDNIISLIKSSSRKEG